MSADSPRFSALCARTGAVLLATALSGSAALAQAPPAPSPQPPSPAPTAAAPAERQMIDLPSALKLAGMNDIDLALIREAENQAKAANDAATLRFFPWLNAGGGYIKDTGGAQAFGGKVSSVNQALYQRSVSVNLPLELGSALFAKLVARQLQAAATSTPRHKGTTRCLPRQVPTSTWSTRRRPRTLRARRCGSLKTTSSNSTAATTPASSTAPNYCASAFRRNGTRSS
jgi:hypothetical protein